MRRFMKNRFLKSVLILSTVLAMVNCSDTGEDSTINGNGSVQVGPNDAAWLINIGQYILIYPTGSVTDASGNIIGSAIFIEGTPLGTIYTADGTVLLENVDLSLFPITTLEQLAAGIPASSADARKASREMMSASTLKRNLALVCFFSLIVGVSASIIS